MAIGAMADENSCGKLTGNFFRMYWKEMFLVIWPLVLLPILFCMPAPGSTPEENAKFRCMYCILLMCGYWVSECIPGVLTGLMALFIFPLANVIDAITAAKTYFHTVNVMFIGSVLVALAIEYCNLHTRLALFIIIHIGSEPKRILLGLILVTMSLSAFMMNSGCTAMMCPIVKAIIQTLEEEGVGSFYEEQTQEEKNEGLPPIPTRPTVAYYCAICYASTMGGVITLVGTTTTLAYKGLVETTYPSADDPVSFIKWFAYNLPAMLIANLLMYAWLLVIHLGMWRPKSKEAEYSRLATEKKATVMAVLRDRYKELGGITWQEGWVGMLFIILVFLWVFRFPNFIPGWANFMVPTYIKAKSKFITNAAPCFGILIIMILMPKTRECCYTCSKDDEKRPKKRGTGLIDWQPLSARMPWGLFFMLGGGFCLATASNESGTIFKYLVSQRLIFLSKHQVCLYIWAKISRNYSKTLQNSSS